MYPIRHTVSITGSTGTVNGYTPVVHGRVLRIEYSSTQYSTGVDITVTGEDSSEPILTKANQATDTGRWYPRTLTNKSTDGSAATDREPPYVAGERIKIAVAAASTSTGVTKVGTFAVVVG